MSTETPQDPLSSSPRVPLRKLVVQKYGGTSLATPRLIHRAAERVKAVREEGYDVVIVASAMGNMTDHLINLAKRTVSQPPQREMDMLITAGERVSMSLLAMALHERGVPAISFTGSQSGIITTSEHSEARILEIRPARIQAALEKNHVVIVAGFQGVSREREITSLGRGGSDTTAVALAATLGAERCDVLTDVEGVFTADPRRVPNARLIPQMDYESAIEFASLGAKMHARSLELARRYRVLVRVASNWGTPLSGTWIGPKYGQRQEDSMETTRIRGIGTKPGQTFLRIQHSLPSISHWIRDAQISLTCVAATETTVDLVCDAARATVLKRFLEGAGIQISAEQPVVVVALVGDGLCGTTQVLPQTMDVLKRLDISCHIVSMNSASVQLAVDVSRVDELTRDLHRIFIEAASVEGIYEPAVTDPLQSSVSAPPTH